MIRLRVPAAGTELLLPLGTRPDGTDPTRTPPQAPTAAVVTVLADLARDIAPHIDPDRADPLRSVEGGTLVEVRIGSRIVLPGAWVRREDVAELDVVRTRRLRPADLRMPAVVLGSGPTAVLAWGETIWPLPFDESLRIPASCRPGVHSRAQLRRLVLAAAGRRREIGVTLWQDPGFEIPWHDVRLVPHARWWFEVAQVPPDLRYADAARAQGVDVERLLPARAPQRS